jgi:hypothetical protein
MTVYTWDAEAVGGSAHGVSASQWRAKRAVSAWMREHRARGAVLEERHLVTEAGLGMSYAPARRRWTARLSRYGRVSWTEQPVRIC